MLQKSYNQSLDFNKFADNLFSSPYSIEEIKSILTHDGDKFPYREKELNILFGSGLIKTDTNLNSRFDVCDAILETFPNFDINNRSYMGLSYLDMVCVKIDIEALDYLIKHNANINKSDYVNFMCENFANNRNASSNNYHTDLNQVLHGCSMLLNAGHNRFNEKKLPNALQSALKKHLLAEESLNTLSGGLVSERRKSAKL